MMGGGGVNNNNGNNGNDNNSVGEEDYSSSADDESITSEYNDDEDDDDDDPAVPARRGRRRHRRRRSRSGRRSAVVATTAAAATNHHKHDDEHDDEDDKDIAGDDDCSLKYVPPPSSLLLLTSTSIGGHNPHQRPATEELCPTTTTTTTTIPQLLQQPQQPLRGVDTITTTSTRTATIATSNATTTNPRTRRTDVVVESSSSTTQQRLVAGAAATAAACSSRSPERLAVLVEQKQPQQRRRRRSNKNSSSSSTIRNRRAKRPSPSPPPRGGGKGRQRRGKGRRANADARRPATAVGASASSSSSSGIHRRQQRQILIDPEDHEDDNNNSSVSVNDDIPFPLFLTWSWTSSEEEEETHEERKNKYKKEKEATIVAATPRIIESTPEEEEEEQEDMKKMPAAATAPREMRAAAVFALVALHQQQQQEETERDDDDDDNDNHDQVIASSSLYSKSQPCGAAAKTLGSSNNGKRNRGSSASSSSTGRIRTAKSPRKRPSASSPYLPFPPASSLGPVPTGRVTSLLQRKRRMDAPPSLPVSSLFDRKRHITSTTTAARATGTTSPATEASAVASIASSSDQHHHDQDAVKQNHKSNVRSDKAAVGRRVASTEAKPISCANRRHRRFSSSTQLKIQLANDEMEAEEITIPAWWQKPPPPLDVEPSADQQQEQQQQQQSIISNGSSIVEDSSSASSSSSSFMPVQPPSPLPPSLQQQMTELFHQNATAYTEVYGTHVEELAYHVYADDHVVGGVHHRHHNNNGTATTITAMKPPEYFDARMLPSNNHDDGSGSSLVTWSYEPINRVVRVDFTQVPARQPLPSRDLELVAQLMQRDDLVIITKGLTMTLPGPEKVEGLLKYLAGSRQLFHKFRRFQRRPKSPHPHVYNEIDGHVAMMPEAFVAYLDHRLNGPKDATVTFQLIDGKSMTVGVHDVLLYMIDADVPQLYPQLEKAYKKEFRWNAIYPGGSLCMMKDLPSQMQPFMGPNLYVTPGNTFTTLHQDGLGTVDSGHSCLFGTNEVLMLRRLPEIHKRQACAMVPSMTRNVSAIDQCENTLYGLPHDDYRSDKQKWPTNELVDQWRALHYCPSVFILTAGEHLHINKGRLHSFRKMSNEPLPDDDCHSALRADHLQSHPIQLDVCVSIAFDWMFLGADAQGINREVATILESAARIRTRKGAKTLAIVETSVFGMAEAVVRGSFLRDELPSRLDIAKGLMPALEVLKEPVRIVNASTLSPELQSIHNAALLYGVELVPSTRLSDADEQHRRSIDPYGSGDYSCKLCNKELANLYFHCEGCDLLLKKDYDICPTCFTTGAFLEYTPIREDALQRKFSHLHHTGQTIHDYESSKCGCKQGTCAGCEATNLWFTTPAKKRCKKCSCKCHKKFSARHRFRHDTETMELVRNVERMAGEEKIKFYRETVDRLKGVPSALNLPVGG